MALRAHLQRERFRLPSVTLCPPPLPAGMEPISYSHKSSPAHPMARPYLITWLLYLSITLNMRFTSFQPLHHSPRPGVGLAGSQTLQSTSQTPAEPKHQPPWEPGMLTLSSSESHPHAMPIDLERRLDVTKLPMYVYVSDVCLVSSVKLIGKILWHRQMC